MAKKKKDPTKVWLKHRWWLAFVGLIGFSVLVYSNSLHGEWHFDDYDSIVYNSNRYLGYFTFALNYSINGVDVFGYHLVNLGLHLLSGLVVWRLILELYSTPKLEKAYGQRGRNWIAFFAAMVFLLHPLQTQSVNYVVQRLAVMAGLFYVLGIWAYVKARLDMDPVQRVVFFVVSGLAFLAGMFTKENVFSWPLMILAVEWFGWGIDKKLWKKLIVGLAILVFLLVLLVVNEYSLGWFFSAKKTKLDEVVTWWSYLITQPRVFIKYTQLLLVPIRQNFDYYFPISNSLTDVKVWLGAVFMGMVVAVVYRCRKNYREITFGIMWILIGLAVTSSIIPIEDVIFEHRLYLPMVGFGLIVGNLIFRKFKTKPEKLKLVFVGFLIVYGSLTFLRNFAWNTELGLWLDTARKSTKKARVQNQAGVHLQKAGRLEEAIEYYKKVLILKPDHADAHYNMAQAMLAVGRIDEAEEYFRKAYELNNEITRAYNFIGLIQLNRGEYEEALESVNKAIDGEPTIAKLYKSKGDVLVGLKKYDEAREAYLTAVELEPINPVFKQSLIELDAQQSN